MPNCSASEAISASRSLDADFSLRFFFGISLPTNDIGLVSYGEKFKVLTG